MITPDIAIDYDWLHRVGYGMERFKAASGSKTTYNARCFICGDSQRSSKITRLYFYKKKGNLNVHCKNCDYSRSFWNFMKEHFPNEFPEYKKEQLLRSFTNNHQPKTKEVEEPSNQPLRVVNGLAGAVPVTSLPSDHEAVKYLKGRSFGEQQIKRLYYSLDFKITANSISHQPLSERFPSEGRIVIPFYDLDGNVEMIQGRSLDSNSNMKYISIKADEEVDKVYGKYELDPTMTSYCVEGPFDSLFVENCLATCDSSLSRSGADVLIWDNQPRSKEIVNLMSNAIDQGHKLVIWPNSPNGKQDINDLIKLGLTVEDLMEVIRSRTYHGMMARLKFNEWRKV